MTHKGTKTIKTNRLTLRRFMPDDAQAVFSNWASDEAVTEFLPWSAHENIKTTKQVLNSWIEKYACDDYYQWAIVQDGTNEPIGTISVVRQDDNISMVHIGYALGKKWWHQGIMSEALAAVIDFFFSEVGVNRIEARHDKNNPHSGGVMRKCGMTYEDTKKQAYSSNRGAVDACFYSIIKDEWKEKYGHKY